MAVDFLSGRLGIASAAIAHSSRHGLVWLDRGNLVVEDGCMSFVSAGGGMLAPGTYGIPHQNVSAILLGPGSTVSHDALRILATHGTALMAVGHAGVRIYSAPPLRPDASRVARNHATIWADPSSRDLIARKMFAIRFGEVFPSKSLDVLRGMEGARVKELYKTAAAKAGIDWKGRDYDRQNPMDADIPNQAINHAATCAYAAAAIAVYSVGAIPQLGFIHESSGDAFCLDIADLYRMEFVVPMAFAAARIAMNDPTVKVESTVRRQMGRGFHETSLIDGMIGRIKDLFGVDDRMHNP